MQLPFRFPFRRLGHCFGVALVVSLLGPFFLLGVFGLFFASEVLLIRWFQYPARIHWNLAVELITKLGYALVFALILLCDYHEHLLFDAGFDMFLPTAGDELRFTLTFLPFALAIDTLAFGSYVRRTVPRHITTVALALACSWLFLALLLLWSAVAVVLASVTLSCFLSLYLVAYPLTLGHALWCLLPWLVSDAVAAKPHAPATADAE